MAGSEGLLRPKEEQELVGFGLKEILGMKKRLPTAEEMANWERQPVFFATNREPLGESEEMGEDFGSGYVDRLQFGVAQIPCPEGRPLVQRELQWAGTLPEGDFKAALRDSVRKDPHRAVLLYVHGCFSDFGRSMGYGAQILRGLDFQGPICVYSWPTVGRPSVRVGLGVVNMYRHDEQTSSMSAPQLKDLLQLLSTEVGARNIHIVAYSMGARTLLEALRLLDPHDLAPDTGVTSHIYFMAPDVTAQFFAQVAKDFKFPKPRIRIQPAVGGSNPNPIPAVGPAPAPAPSQWGAGGGLGHVRTQSPEEEATEPKEEMGFSDSAAMGVGPGVLPLGETVFSVLDQMVDIVGDTVSGIRTSGKVWREGRKQGWGDLLNSVFGNEEVSPDPSAEEVQPRRNAHLHLYAARNDIALLLSELMDSGVPQIRAGRCTTEFVLCNSRGAFDTIDASALKSGVLTSGHFYLFHKIVRADMKHVVEGKMELPWWRQAERWRSYDYYKLRVSVPLPTSPLGTSSGSGLGSSLGSGPVQMHTSPLLWASP